MEREQIFHDYSYGLIDFDEMVARLERASK
jgi:hypothetical protein